MHIVTRLQPVVKVCWPYRGGRCSQGKDLALWPSLWSLTATHKMPLFALCLQQLEEKLKGQADYEEVKKELK